MPSDEPPPYPIVCDTTAGGTKSYLAPESYRRVEAGTRIHAKDRLPADMFGFVCAVLRILTGTMKSAIPDTYAAKKLLCEADLPSLWHNTLGKNPRTGRNERPVPDEWEDCIQFLQQILTLRPEDRLTPAAALLHPFILKADRFRKEAIPKTAQKRSIGGRLLQRT